MRTATINIGMKQSTKFKSHLFKIDEQLIIKELNAIGVQVICHRLAQSNTELTFVARITSRACLPIILKRLIKVSDNLRQDCIAVKADCDVGYLVGSYTSEWGVFDNDCFITMTEQANKEGIKS